jgi:hypothetical protein
MLNLVNSVDGNDVDSLSKICSVDGNSMLFVSFSFCIEQLSYMRAINARQFNYDMSI